MNEYPKIRPISENAERPLISVMIPVCDRKKFLRQNLESILTAGISSNDMQICIIDNSKTHLDWSSILRDDEKDRIEVYIQPTQVSMSENWNTCIQKANGFYVHILHDDDWILPGFYQTIKALINRHRNVSLIATRSFGVDEQGYAKWITPRLINLEEGGNDVSEFFINCPVQCPGVVVERKFYEIHGGFDTRFGCAIDLEMWIRVISKCGGVITPEILACYRVHDGSETLNYRHTGRDLHSYRTLYLFLAEQFPSFDYNTAMENILGIAFYQFKQFRKEGDFQAANSSLGFWQKNAPKKLKLKRFFVEIARFALGKIS